MDNALSIVPFDDLAQELSEQEQQFLYQLEVVGIPVIRAAEISGIKSPYVLLKKSYIIAAREKYRSAVRGRTDFTRDDVIAGMKQAIDQASVLADPMSQIAGWREIAKLRGYDKAPSININLTGTIDQLRKQVQAMPTEKLLELAGDNNILDGDFYRVHEHARPDGE